MYLWLSDASVALSSEKKLLHNQGRQGTPCIHRNTGHSGGQQKVDSLPDF